MHCHHYNINLQKTLEDTLGAKGVELLYRSVERANYDVFRSLLEQYTQIKTLKSKLEIACIMYQNSGMGVLRFNDVGIKGGQVFSPSSHHVTGWLAKHGRRDTPGCHFARGWLAGAFEAIFAVGLGYFAVEERACKMMRDSECHFRITVRRRQAQSPAVSEMESSDTWQ
jgi:hypothetical protein